MLQTLRIRNLALVADLTLELGPGLSIFTGETGAGKSLIVGALGLLLSLWSIRDIHLLGSKSVPRLNIG